MKILFVYQKLLPFVKRDLDILAERHRVRPRPFRGWLDIPALLHDVLWCDLSFSWFGKLHAFFAVLFCRILAKKGVVVAGGDDVACHTVAGQPYGLCAHPWKKWFARATFKFADQVISISYFNLQETLRNAGAASWKTQLIYHGFDHQHFRKPTDMAKDGLVVTVGMINHENYYRKGFKLFVETAHLLPEVRFMLVGPDEDGSIELLRKTAPPNLTFTGGCYGQELIEILSRASVYVQASEWESFGCALAEAMLCECVPVVLKGTALPEVVGGCGYYIEKLDRHELAEAIKEAVRDRHTGLRARERIVELFPLEKRKKALLEAIESVVRG